MDPISGAFGLLAAIPGAQAAQMSAMIQWMALQEAKRNAERQFRVSTAGRSDAYGNMQKYDEILNEWITKLTPTQERIIKAGESEQLKSLTEDAMRNRLIKQRAAERGREAGRDYATALAGFRYDQPKSEMAIRDEIASLLTNADVAQAKELQSQGIRQAARANRGADIAKIIKEVDDAIGQRGGNIRLMARQQAGGEAAQRQAAHQSRYLPALQMFAQLMDQGGDMPLRFSDTPEKLMAMQGQQAGLVQGALAQGGNLELNAATQLAKTVANTGLDMRGIASIISAMQGRSPSRTTATTQKAPAKLAMYAGDDLSWYDRDRDDYGYDWSF
jgi:hypothetical protein